MFDADGHDLPAHGDQFPPGFPMALFQHSKVVPSAFHNCKQEIVRHVRHGPDLAQLQLMLTV
jgi:hypothetical protein